MVFKRSVKISDVFFFTFLFFFDRRVDAGNPITHVPKFNQSYPKLEKL